MTKFNKKPVVFLAFANDKMDQSRYLRNLSIELTGIRKALQPAVEENLCEVIERPNASIEDIMDVFENKNLRNRIAIFHYGGHADGYQLLLENADGTPHVAHGKGLISFLKKRDNLKVVFLNGCSTEQQALELTKQGTSCVIATRQTIDDATASRLAIRFYKSLAQGFSIVKCWDEATDEIKIRQGENYRMLYRKHLNDTAPDQFPWRIYFRKGSDIIKRWNLPDASENPLFGLPDIPKSYKLPENPYLFLKQYEREHAKIFFGRSYYIRALYNRISDRNASPVILFYGQSGVGKSSLLDAGLFPRLEKEYTVIYARRVQKLGLSETLQEALNKVRPDSKMIGENELSKSLESIEANIHNLQKVEKALSGDARQKIVQLISELEEKKDYIQNNRLKKLSQSASSIQLTWLQIEAYTKKPLVVLLDQVEEVFTRPRQELPTEIDDFVLQLKTIFGKLDQYPKGKLILSYRKEFHPEIREALRTCELPRTDVFLDHLNRKDISEIVQGMTLSDELKDYYKIRVDTDLGNLIADDLTADPNSPIAAVLQILLTRMWERNSTRRKRDQSTLFTVEMYREMKRKGLAMSEFFERQIAIVQQSFPEAVNSGLVLDILKHHTTEMLAAESVSSENLKKWYADHNDILEALIQKLKAVYLLNDSETDNHATILIHDTLAPVVIREYNESDKVGQHAARLLTSKRLDSNREIHDIWLDGADLKAVEMGRLGMRSLTNIERKIVSKSVKKRQREQNKVKVIKSALIILGVSVSVFAILFYTEKNNAQKEAYANRLTAQALEWQESDATDALRIAEKALITNPSSVGVLNVLGKIYAENIFHQKTFWHKKAVRCVAFSPNNKHILTGTEGNIAKLWNVESGYEVRVFDKHTDRVSVVAFSPDGSKILTGSRDKTIILQNIQGDTLRTMKGHTGDITAVQFSPDGSKILTTSADKLAKVWDQNGNFQYDLQGHEQLISSATFTPDGQHILTADLGGIIKIWDLNGNGQTIFQKPELNIFALDISPDGNEIVLGTSEPSAWIYNLKNQKIRSLKPHQGMVKSVKFAPNGEYVVSGSDDHTVILSNAKTGKMIFEFKAHEQKINALTFSKDSKQLLTASEDGTSKLINIQGNEAKKFQCQYPITALDFSKEKKKYNIAIGLKNGIVFLHQKENNTFTKFHHPEGILDLRFAPKNHQIVTVGSDKIVRLWDTNYGKLTRAFHGHKSRIYACDITPDGTKILTSSNDHTVKIWDIKTGKNTITIDEENDHVRTLKCFPRQSKFVSGSWQGVIKIRTLEGNTIFQKKVHKNKINAVAISSDGNMLLSGGDDNNAVLFNMKNNEQRTLKMSNNISSVDFSPDDKYVITGSVDQTVVLWDLEGNAIFRLKKHDAAVRDVAFSPDGSLILTGGDDQTVRLTYTPYAFLKQNKLDRLSLAHLFQVDPKANYKSLLKQKNTERWREAAYFFERKAQQETNYEVRVSNLKIATQFYDALITKTENTQNRHEASEAYTKLAEMELYLNHIQSCLGYAEKAINHTQQTNQLHQAKLIKVLAHAQKNEKQAAYQALVHIPHFESTLFFDQWDKITEKLKQSNPQTNQKMLIDLEHEIIEKWKKSDTLFLQKYITFFRQKSDVIDRHEYEKILRFTQHHIILKEHYIQQKNERSKNDSLNLATLYLEKGYYELFNKQIPKSKESLDKSFILCPDFLNKLKPYQQLKVAFIYLYYGEPSRAKKIFMKHQAIFKENIMATITELEVLGVTHTDVSSLQDQIKN